MAAEVIWVLAPDVAAPVGGMKTLYRHVDVLNEAGYRSSVLHLARGFRCRWFANQTRVTALAETAPGPGDTLVLPEIYGHLFQNGARRRTGLKRWLRGPTDDERILAAVAAVGRIVVLNLNCYTTFQRFGLGQEPARSPYRHARAAATLVVSEDSREYLAFAFPGQPVHRIHNSVDPEVFRPAARKRDQICFMSRKLATDLEQVFNLLRSRGTAAGFVWQAIRDLDEARVAAILGESRVFLSFSHAEGSQRPPKEAMLAGCLVVGYDGRGGREYFRPELCFPVAEGDVLGFARTLEQVLATLGADRTAFDRMLTAAREHIARHYSRQQEREDIVAAWRAILG